MKFKFDLRFVPVLLLLKEDYVNDFFSFKSKYAEKGRRSKLYEAGDICLLCYLLYE